MILIGLFDFRTTPSSPQRKVKGETNECLLAYYLQDKGKILASYYTRTLYGVLKKTNKGLS